MGNKFVTLYAAHVLGASDADGNLLLFVNALAGLLSLLVGGAVYDALSHRGVLLFVSLLNSVHLLARLVHVLLHATRTLSLPALCVLMVLYGLTAPLPTNLPFQVYAVSFGGARHCATLVCAVEVASSVLAAATQVLQGRALAEQAEWVYPLTQLALVALATVVLARFFYEDWQDAPPGEHEARPRSAKADGHDRERPAP